MIGQAGEEDWTGRGGGLDWQRQRHITGMAMESYGAWGPETL